VKNRKVEAVEERSSVLKGLAQWFSPPVRVVTLIQPLFCGKLFNPILYRKKISILYRKNKQKWTRKWLGPIITDQSFERVRMFVHTPSKLEVADAGDG
jgi:hypothetical protein